MRWTSAELVTGSAFQTYDASACMRSSLRQKVALGADERPLMHEPLCLMHGCREVVRSDTWPSNREVLTLVSPP